MIGKESVANYLFGNCSQVCHLEPRRWRREDPEGHKTGLPRGAQAPLAMTG